MKHFRLKRVVALAIFLFVGLPVLMAQVKVSGQIVDEQGEPLMAVSILEKGTANGIITDIDGNFELSVRNDGAVLVISYVGYVTQEVKVQTGKKMNIILKEDSQALEELVVVGYGVQKKSSLTGAVSQVKSEDMEARTITRPEQALQGKTAGVQVLSASARPGASPSVRI
ncbi:MAG: carboxypeptidase-like regulatory domain-containing protein, partial [Bacteroidaceae bacterium]|nr:carboxypeptidase-like regulatory domain-containing protein [Bacteroidaceae bacterium]